MGCMSVRMKRAIFLIKDPLRVKKLLMHRTEISKLQGSDRGKGYTLVPLQVYFKGSLVKGADRSCQR